MKKKWLTFAIILLISLSVGLMGMAEDKNEEEANDLIDISIEDSGYNIEVINKQFQYIGKEIRLSDSDFEIVYKDPDNPEEDSVILEKEFFEVTYENNVNVTTELDKARIIVTGDGETYTGSIYAEFEILPKELTNFECTVVPDTMVYDGNTKLASNIIVTNDGAELRQDIDYEVLGYKNNIEVGTATIEIIGKGNYTGKLVGTFEIKSFGTISKITTTATYKQVKLTWNKIEGAEGYVIQRKISGGKYKTLKTIKGEGILKYTDTSVQIGQKYVYRLRAYRTIAGKKVYSTYTSEKSQKVQLAAPKISSLKRKNYKTIEISWNKISGATGYKVYRSTREKGTYSLIATVNGNSKLSLTDSNCSCGVTYYYKVRAYRIQNSKIHYGVYSETRTMRTQPPKVNITASEIKYNSIKLSWKKSAMAQGYELYRSTSSNKGYKLIKTIKGNTLCYEDTGLKKHQVYYYKIRPYVLVNGSRVYGTYSNIYDKPQSGWRYVNGDKLYYNANGVLVSDIRNLIGKQDSYEIKVNKQRNVVTVYTKDSVTGKYCVPVVSFICSCGAPTPVGTFEITGKYRWGWLVGPSWGKYCCRYSGKKLFHSVPYLREEDPYSLGVSMFNRLGQTESHGCIRLLVGDAKWIYDNCAKGTKIIIYKDSNAGPFGKPSAPKLESWHTWDPTDIDTKWKCKQMGCH